MVKPRKWRASASLMLLPHFDVLCDLLLNRPMATWNLFVLYNDQKRKRPIHIPASYRLTVRGFVRVKAFFKSRTLLFVSAPFFSFILLVYRFFEEFFKVFFCFCSMQNNGENILENSESPVTMTHFSNCCEDFF